MHATSKKDRAVARIRTRSEPSTPKEACRVSRVTDGYCRVLTVLMVLMLARLRK
jgi:hypothetical protein